MYNARTIMVCHQLLKMDFAVEKQNSECITMKNEVNGYTLHIINEGNSAVIRLGNGDFGAMSRVHDISEPEDLAAFTAQLEELMPTLTDVLRSGQSVGDVLFLGDVVASKDTSAHHWDLFRTFPEPAVGFTGMASGDMGEAEQVVRKSVDCEHLCLLEFDEELTAAIRKSEEQMAKK